MSAPWVVAEIGGNHRGEIGTAKRMVEILATYCSEHFDLDVAHIGDVHRRLAVKFQKRTPSLELYPEWSEPHPNEHHAYGDTYLAHRQALEFDVKDHQTLRFWSETRGVTYACSVWDIPAAREIISLRPRWIKVPSARNTDYDLLDVLYDEYKGDVHVSLGMITRPELKVLTDYIGAHGVGRRTVFYACTSGYPVPAEDVCLGELTWLQDRYGGLISAFGFSGHHHGIAIDMAAVALGAEYIERHYTLNRTWRGTDHAASLEPDGVRKLLRDTGAVTKALGRKPSGGVLEIEKPQREKLRWRELSYSE
jgi:N-acetylneuraminate synthase